MRLLKYLLAFILMAVPVVTYAQSTEDQAKTAFDQCKYSDAAKLYELAAQMAESSNASKAKTLKQKAQTAKRAATLRSHGDKSWNNKDYTTAETNYKALIKLNSKDSTAKKRLAEIEKMQSATNNNNTKGDNTTQNKPKQNSETTDNTAQENKANDIAEEQKKHLEQAMYWYGEKEYIMAKQCFEKAGIPMTWNKQQLDAYRVTVEEAKYLNWQTAEGASRRNLGEDFLKYYPKSSHAQEIKDYLFNSCLADNSVSSLNTAEQYATTAAQKQQLKDAKKKYQKEHGEKEQYATTAAQKQQLKEHGKNKRSSKYRSSLSWEPTFGIGVEAAGLLQKGSDLAIPVEMKLFEDEQLFNMSIGVRLAAKGTLLGSEWISTLNDSACFKYHQVSPYINIKLRFNKDISQGAFYIAARGNINFNLGYSYSNYYLGSLLEFGTATTKVSDALNTITYTVGGELGYGSEMAEFYFYYTYDLKNAIKTDYNGLSSVQTRLLNSELKSYYERLGIFGVGVRIYLDM